MDRTVETIQADWRAATDQRMGGRWTLTLRLASRCSASSTSPPSRIAAARSRRLGW